MKTQWKLLVLAGAASFLVGMCSSPGVRGREPSPQLQQASRNGVSARSSGAPPAFSRTVKDKRVKVAADPDHAIEARP